MIKSHVLIERPLWRNADVRLIAHFGCVPGAHFYSIITKRHLAHYQQRHGFAEDGDCLEGEGPAARGCAAHSDEA
jgi:hypothetical protein